MRLNHQWLIAYVFLYVITLAPLNICAESSQRTHQGVLDQTGSAIQLSTEEGPVTLDVESWSKASLTNLSKYFLNHPVVVRGQSRAGQLQLADVEHHRISYEVPMQGLMFSIGPSTSSIITSITLGHGGAFSLHPFLYLPLNDGRSPRRTLIEGLIEDEGHLVPFVTSHAGHPNRNRTKLLTSRFLVKGQMTAPRSFSANWVAYLGTLSEVQMHQGHEEDLLDSAPALIKGRLVETEEEMKLYYTPQQFERIAPASRPLLRTFHERDVMIEGTLTSQGLKILTVWPLALQYHACDRRQFREPTDD